MARITPSALVDDIKGSAGGVTFASWKGITIVRSKARSVRNPATEAQANIRDSVGFFSKRYHDDLTDGQRAAWDQHAQEMAGAQRADEVQGGFGSRVVPKRQFQKSGNNWYVGSNVRLVRMLGAGHYAAPIDDAPIGKTAPSQPELESVGYNALLGRFLVRGRTPRNYGDTTFVQIGFWIKPNWGTARMQHEARGLDPPGHRVDWFWEDILITRGVLSVPVPDGIYAFQLDAVGEDNGLLSPPSDVVILQAKFGGPGAFFSSDPLEMKEWRESHQVPSWMT